MKEDKYLAGTWLRLKTSGEGNQIASCGMDGLAVHLNANPYVTGEVFAPSPHSSGDEMVCFKPDGWPLPPGTHPEGFLVPAKNVEIISADTHEPEPCVITDRRCRPLPESTVKKMIQDYLERKE